MNSLTAKISDFAQSLRSGKLSYTREELLPYIQEAAGGEDTAKARAALCARLLAATLGVDLVVEGGKYVFTQPAEQTLVPHVVIKEVPVEKVVEKIVYRDRTDPAPKAEYTPDRFETPVVFPKDPLAGKLNPNYVVPAWQKRMEAALEAGKHVAISGPPGGGKSTAAEQYFIKKGQKFVVVNGDAGFRRRDMEGSTEIQGGTTFFRVAEFAAAAVNGWGAILNEVNAADPDALLFINGMLEVPHCVNVCGRAYAVHPDFRLVVTLNFGLLGTKPLPQAFVDRFHSIKLGYPPKEFLIKMIKAKTGVGAEASYMKKLVQYAVDCWALNEQGTLRAQVSPRRLFDVVWLMESGVCSDLNEAIRMGVIDSYNAHADCQMLTKLLSTSSDKIAPSSRYA